MRDFVWLALGVLLFLAWGLSYIVFHVAGLLIHLLLLLALVSVMFQSAATMPTYPAFWFAFHAG
jgi:hypothetical protein